jgi:DNA gyrase/topoisomerase IV subunit B
MSSIAAVPSDDVVSSIVRALVLYTLAEFQSGSATFISVHAEALAFQVSDNGRGHAVHRTVAGHPYMHFVYTHLDFPFTQSSAPPVQLHGIGLSFINTLCSQLVVTAHKPEGSFRCTYRDGHLVSEETLTNTSSATGNVVAGVLSSRFQQRGVDVQRLRQWLASVAAASPGLTLQLNDALLTTHNAA